MDEGVSIEKNHKNKVLKSGVIFFLLISLNQKKDGPGNDLIQFGTSSSLWNDLKSLFCYLFK